MELAERHVPRQVIVDLLAERIGPLGRSAKRRFRATGDAMLIAQITDFHVKRPGERAYGVVDTAPHLERAVAQINGDEIPYPSD